MGMKAEVEVEVEVEVVEVFEVVEVGRSCR